MMTKSEPLRFIRSYKEKALDAIRSLPDSDIATLIEILAEARQQGRLIFTCGNGGSASTASHFANDLGKGASVGRKQRFRVLALTDNIAWMTALANDLDYSEIFVEQLKNYANSEDVLIAFSGSGNSPNVIKAVEWANKNGLKTVGVTGRPGGKLGAIAQTPIFVESGHMGRIEEGHFLIQHLVGYFFMESDSNL
jgi:D-sedoheptulose 7-phosphate isomerase